MSNVLISQHNPIRIVLVEDDEDDQLVFSDALAELPLNTHLTILKDGFSALDFIYNPASAVPHIIFLDINMPKMNGIECLDKIRKNKKLANTPCLMLTTSTSPLDMEKSYQCGANLYLEKPMGFIKLQKMLAKVLQLNWEEYFPAKREVFFQKTLLID